MPFVMRILVMHTNGQLVAWHNHIICKVHIQLWTIAYPSQQGRVGVRGTMDRVFTEYSCWQLSFLPGRLPATFRARNGRVVCCCLIRTYCIQWYPHHFLLSTDCTVNTHTVDVLSILLEILFRYTLKFIPCRMPLIIFLLVTTNSWFHFIPVSGVVTQVRLTRT